jgi:hypothetical protein
VENAAAPFFTGGPIPTALAAQHLHGYEEEQRTITQRLNRRGRVRLGVLGPPQSGRTSILLAVANDMPAPHVILQCDRIWPALPSAVYAHLREALGGRRGARLDGAAADVYPRLPMPAKDSRGVLILDNADRLAEIDGGLLDAMPLLAERLPWHLVITGPVGELADHVEEAVTLGPFSEATSHDFIRRRLAAAGMTIDPEALAVFDEFSRGRPSLLQRMGMTVWRIVKLEGRTHVTVEDVDRAVGELVDHLPSRTIAPWTQVRGMMRDVFIAMCLHDLDAPTQIARRLDLEPKNVVVLLGRLAGMHGLIERVDRGRYVVRDPLLKHHVRKEWGSPVLR